MVTINTRNEKQKQIKTAFKKPQGEAENLNQEPNIDGWVYVLSYTKHTSTENTL